MPVKLSIDDKIEIVLIVGENYKTCREAAEIFNNRHPDKAIHFTTVSDVINKFKSTGSVENKFRKKHRAWVRTEDTEGDVMQSVVENPKYSVRRRSNLLNVSKTTVARILKANKFKPYKPQFTHTLKEGDVERRFEFCVRIQGELEENRFMTRHVLFSDEATFTSNGVVSSQNCRWWSDINPNFHVQTRDQYSFKTNVWCGIYKDRLVGPFFFRNNINGDRYLQFLNNQLSDFLDELPINELRKIWYQQDGAPCHCTRNIRDFLLHTFDGRVMGRYMEFLWPPRSPDLTPLDFFCGAI